MMDLDPGDIEHEREWIDALNKAKERIAALEAALRPFAHEAYHLDCGCRECDLHRAAFHALRGGVTP